MGLKNNPQERADTIFATILADGKIHVNVPKDTEGAVERKYATDADKKAGPDVKTGVKWEHVYTELSGMIQAIKFHEGDYGINLLVVVGEEGDEKPVTLAISTESNFGEDLMKKIPNIDLSKPVTLAPYSFDNDAGKKVRGISVTQPQKKGDPVKIVSAFYDTEKKSPTNGYPKPPVVPKGKKLPASKWRAYFSDAREFLIEYVTEHNVFGEEKAEGETEEDAKARRKANKVF